MVCLQDGQCFEGHFFANSFELHDCVDFALIERRSRWLWVWFLLPYSVMPKPSKPVLANINQILIHPTFLHASTRYWESQLCCAVFNSSSAWILHWLFNPRNDNDVQCFGTSARAPMFGRRRRRQLQVCRSMQSCCFHCFLRWDDPNFIWLVCIAFCWFGLLLVACKLLFH